MRAAICSRRCPAQTTIIYDGPADAAKPKLYILAIGINNYVDRGGEDPISHEILQFPPLVGSVPDAKAFSAEMEKAGASQYEKVRVTLALDDDATLSKLDEVRRQRSPARSARATPSCSTPRRTAIRLVAIIT